MYLYTHKSADYTVLYYTNPCFTALNLMTAFRILHIKSPLSFGFIQLYSLHRVCHSYVAWYKHVYNSSPSCEYKVFYIHKYPICSV